MRSFNALDATALALGFLLARQQARSNEPDPGCPLCRHLSDGWIGRSRAFPNRFTKAVSDGGNVHSLKLV